MWKIPWSVVLRFIADMPSQKYLSEKELKEKQMKKLTPQTSKDFKSFMDKIGAKKK